MIVLDASVVIAHFDASDAHHGTALDLLDACAAEGFVMSPVTMAAVLVGPARSGRLDEAIEALAALGVTTVALDDGAPAQLARLRAATQLKLPDCCVILAAESVDSRLATFDDRLGSVAEGRGITVRR